MINFSQWWKTYSKNEKIHEHYYLLGPERTLVEEVIEQVVNKLQVKSWNLQRLSVGLHDDGDVWDDLFRSSVDGGAAVTVVTGVDKLTNMQLLPELVRVKSPTHVVIFVSYGDKIEKVAEEQEDGSRKYVLPPEFAGFEKKGRIIECVPFTQNTAKVAVSWVQTKMESSDDALVYLLNEANGDMRKIKDVITKMKWMRVPATKRSVNVFLEGTASDTLSSALLSRDKKTAMAALRELEQSEYVQLIGHLDAQVDLAGRVHDSLAKHKSIPEIMKEVGSQAFLVPGISKVAKYYGRDKRQNIRKLLAETDRRIRRGAGEGVMESLIALW